MSNMSLFSPFFIAELPSLLPIVEVAEALLHVHNGDWFLCLLVANVPDSFNEGDFFFFQFNLTLTCYLVMFSYELFSPSLVFSVNLHQCVCVCVEGVAVTAEGGCEAS